MMAKVGTDTPRGWYHIYEREKARRWNTGKSSKDRQTVELDYLMSWVQLSLVEEGEKEKDHRTEGSRGNVMKKFVQKISNDFYCQ